MSPGEIRYWIRTLMQQHGWRQRCLSRALGCNGDVTGMLRGHWCGPREQARYTKQIGRILSGELVQEARRSGSATRYDAVVADHPTPLRATAIMALDPKTMRLRWLAPPLHPAPVLPSFARGLEAFEGGYGGSS